MLVVVSPAKSLDMAPVNVQATQPVFQADALRLSKTMRNLTLAQLQDLMGISDALARLNRDRFKSFSETIAATAKPAGFAFNGDTYQGLAVKTMSAEGLAWAQDHLRILSGLYGLLRPLDAIQPYRLEMGSRVKTHRGSTLYAYWGDTLAKALTDLAQDLDTQTLVNCASQEYFKAADYPALKLRVITPRFLELQDGTPRMISFFAKRARGAMARFVLENRLTDAEGIKDFTSSGYTYTPGLSKDDTWAFLRDYPA